MSSNPSTQCPSPTNPTPANGKHESETPGESKYPGKYKLEDFSQPRINRGQQEINYWINEAHEKTLVVLNEIKTAIAPSLSSDSLKKLCEAIEQVSEATKKIAGPFPPGCAKPQSEE